MRSHASQSLAFGTPLWERCSGYHANGARRQAGPRHQGRKRMKGFFAALMIVLAALCCGAVSAQDKWPSRPVTVIVPFAAGGNTDVMARIFAEHLGKRLGQQFVIENKPGAGGVT